MSLRHISPSFACFAAALLLAGAASAQTYPTKPVRNVVPGPPSGAIEALPKGSPDGYILFAAIKRIFWVRLE